MVNRPRDPALKTEGVDTLGSQSCHPQGWDPCDLTDRPCLTFTPSSPWWFLTPLETSMDSAPSISPGRAEEGSADAS